MGFTSTFMQMPNNLGEPTLNAIVRTYSNSVLLELEKQAYDPTFMSWNHTKSYTYTIQFMRFCMFTLHCCNIINKT